MIKQILVVCVGNICRSPMAEALLKTALRGQAGLTVESAGLGALVGYPASDYALELMQEIGEDISAHRARQIHPDMVKAADLVLVMEAGHKRAIDDADPSARGKVHRLGEWQDRDIEDPYRQPKAAFADALDDIQDGVASWVRKNKGITTSMKKVWGKTGIVLLALALGACAVAPGMKMQEPAKVTGGQVVRVTPITMSLLTSMEKVRRSHVREIAAEFSVQNLQYLIGAGDVLQIIVWDHPELTIPARVVSRPRIVRPARSATTAIFIIPMSVWSRRPA